MGFRFRKSFKLAPGVRLNLSKKSMGLSFGGKGARLSVNSSGRKTASVGVPGTGVSYSKTFGGPSSKHRRVQTDPDMSYTQDSPDLTPPPPKQPANKKKIIMICAIVAAVLVGFYIIGVASGWTVDSRNKEPQFSLTAEELVKEFEGDRDATNQKYENAVVEIKGVVQSVRSGKVILESGHPTISVQCEMLEGTASEGETVSIKGIYQERLSGILLEGCTITESHGILEESSVPEASEVVEESSREESVESTETESSTVTESSKAPVVTEPESSKAPQPTTESSKTPPAEPSDPNEDVKVYRTKTGKRYHFDSTCGNGTYYECTLADALDSGLTPCEKCAQ